MATATRAGGVVARVVRSTVAAEATDRELLERFAVGDEAAFAALVARYGCLVQGVCRRVLPTEQDAEDATQAVFLILAKKAAGGRWQSSVANWLYTTARMIAAKANRSARRRTKREARPVVPAAPSALDQMSGREAFAALDAELDRLPPIYREPLVLCHLQGLTRDEAAARLSVPVGTLKTRLERGRKRLADALTKRGIVLGAGLLALAATSPAGASPPRLVESVLATVGGTPPESVAALARGVAMTGTLTRMKFALMAVVGVTAVGLGLAAVTFAADPPKMDKPKAEQKAEAKKPADTPKERGVTGTVTGPDGKPVQAEVILIRPNGKPESLGKTGADGAFKLTIPPIEYGYLIAVAEGHGVAFTFVSRKRNTSGEVSFKLAKDNVIRGRVIDTQGKPVAGATVFPYRVDDYGNKGADIFLKHWMAKDPQYPPLHGETDIQLRENTGFDLPDGRTVLATKTDDDGKFQLHGVGAERVVMLAARGPGIADTEIMVVNRADFDPTEADKAAADNRERMLPQSLRSSRTPPHLHGPTVTLVAEQEKIVRGVVTDRDTGKPRAGVTVSFSRINGTSLQWHDHSAITDKDGKYEIHGSKKQPEYIPEVLADAESGYLPAQGEAKDTAGYEPIVIDIPTAKGIILTGTLKNKETGKLLPGAVYAEPMQENPFLKKLPTMTRSGPTYAAVREDGTYRLVIPPGPVLLMAGAHSDVMFKPPQADPKYPQYFRPNGDLLMYVTANGGYTTIRGCWCKVIDVAEGEKTATQDVEFEPTTRKAVKVVDADGKPVKSCNVAGMEPQRNYPLYQDSSTVNVYGLEPKKERLVVVCEQRTKLIGSMVVKESDKEPMVTLRAGGTVTGRAMDADGKPLAGVVIRLHHLTPKADDIFGLLHEAEQVTTDADGKFRIEHVVPGFEFRLAFSKGSKNLGPKVAKAPKYAGPKSGESADLGDVKVDSIGT